MEEMFKKSQVLAILDKAILEGKIDCTKYFIDWIDNEIKEKTEWFEHLNENGEFRSERWIECNSELQTLSSLKHEFFEALKTLEEAKAK